MDWVPKVDLEEERASLRECRKRPLFGSWWPWVAKCYVKVVVAVKEAKRVLS